MLLLQQGVQEETDFEGAHVHTHRRQAIVMQMVRRTVLVRINVALASPALSPGQDGTTAYTRNLFCLWPAQYARELYQGCAACECTGSEERSRGYVVKILTIRKRTVCNFKHFVENIDIITTV